ncbi:AAA family ATPase [Candidatus Saccharibacteria bacterium]|nr:AAA family ATPase [Candidatus Saccharibacteria bacterium]
MIERINNFTLKSFENYTTEEDCKFLKNNVIFGYNGKGKSSLANGIVETYLKSGGVKENVRFYNRSYVEENLLLGESDANRHIKGVIANFGKKDTDIEKEIIDLESKKIDVQNIILQKNSVEHELDSIINSTHNQKKGASNIQRKPANKTATEKYNLYIENLNKVTKDYKVNEGELRNLIGDDSLEKKKLILDEVSISEVHSINDDLFQKIKEIFSIEFNDNLIPIPKVMEWLNYGLEIHENSRNDICQFCGNHMILDDIKKKIDTFNNDQKQVSILKLNELKEKIEQIITAIDSNIKKQQIIESVIGNPIIGEIFINMNKEKKILESCIDTVRKKVENITNRDIEYMAVDKNVETIEYLNKQLKEIIKDEKDNLNHMIDRIGELVKGAIGLSLKENSIATKKLNLISEYKRQYEEAIKNNNKIDKKIEELKRSKSPTSDFAKFITGILNALGMNFEIVVDSDCGDYIIKIVNKSSDMLKISDISEGEKNILALLFFYYELFEDKDQNDLKNNIELIVIDDPIASLDEINHTYILGLVEQIMNLEPQVFIFTHSWEDFSTINYRFKENKNNPINRFFEVKKDNNGKSFLKKSISRISPYHHHFNEVYEFSKKDINNLDDCDVYHMPNIIRQVLESFLKLKTTKSSPTMSNRTEVQKVLFGDNNVRSNDSTCLDSLLLTINIDSHRPERNPEEVIKVAKFLMKRIEMVGLQHFNTFKAVQY